MRRAIRLLAIATLLAFATAGVAQDYPTKTIHLITGEAGGGNDTGTGAGSASGASSLAIAMSASVETLASA